MRTKIACIAVMVLFLSACGGSGGSGSSRIGEDASCSEPGCGREADPDDSPQAPAEETPVEVPDEPLACGTANSPVCPDGYHCVSVPMADCDPATGVDCSGTCVLGEEFPRCGTLENPPCPEGYVCADDPADDCEGGPAVDCGGVCRPQAEGQCTTDADCPRLDAPCTVCADGSRSCPSARCDGGVCTFDFKPCSEAQVCGGVSGLGCDPGFQCVDDPTDECDSNTQDADCRGICVPDEKPPECNGIAGLSCPPGFECVDDPDDMCDPNDGGADCPGLCQPGSGGECTDDADCPALPVPCSPCPDGNVACPRPFCENGRCNLTYPTCPTPADCTTDADCPTGYVCTTAPDVMCDPNDPATGCGGVCIPHYQPPSCGAPGDEPCPDGYACVEQCDPNGGGNDCRRVCEPEPPPPCEKDEECAGIQACSPCPDGSLSCSQAVCRDGQCVDAGLHCNDFTECTSDETCAVPQVCEMCPDGSFSCPHGECSDGVCIAVYPGCNSDPGFCGGIAGFPCEPGYTCVDDPGDDCDPAHGGADCAGKCVRQEEPPKCGGIAGESCPDGYECADVEGDDCDPSTGSDCPSYCRPSSGTACASDADCPQIGAPCRICADGTAACPRSFCENGQCKAEFGGCGAEL